jgi:type II secretory pathway component GspD/PulD (secretin)
MTIRFGLLSVLLLVTALALAPARCVALVYATVTDVSASQLTNSIQITVKADGILDWKPDNSSSWYGGNWSGRSDKVALRLSNARCSVKNFVDVSMYPVSYVQTYVPQDAANGVGVCLVVALFCESDFDVTVSPDRQSLIITVKTTRTIEPNGKAAAPASVCLKPGFTCKCENGLVSVDVLAVDMLKVLHGIAKEAGLSIVVDDAVAKRTVNMSVQNTKPEELLQYIASAYGLSLSKSDDGAVWMVSEGVPNDLATYRASGTQSFPMKSVRAQTASELLPTFLYSYLHVNAEQNAVVVSAPTQMLAKIGSDLAKVDVRPPQIMIEAVAVETSSEGDLSALLGLKGDNVNSGQIQVDTESGGISYTTVGKLPNEFEARLKLLVAQHKAKIRSTPRMAVINGQKAEIFVGATRFMRVEYSEYSGTKLEKIQSVDVGTHITISPWTGGNGEITTSISPEVSNVIELDRATGLPTLSSRRASTTVRVKDGETIVIGGLTQQQDYYTKRSIPILGDIPLLGTFFRSKSRHSTSTDLVILVTPRILADSGHLPNAEEESALRQRMLGSK